MLSGARLRLYLEPDNQHGIVGLLVSRVKH
jgi:hypothetical protein